MGIFGLVTAALTIFTTMFTIAKSIDDGQKAEAAQKQSEDLAQKSLETQTTIADQNFGLEKEQFEYQKQLNQLQMQREDTAMQRQVADLKAAGLSPLMASGGSSTGQYLSASAPQMNGSGILNAMSNLLGVKSDYASRKQAAYQFERQQGLQMAQQFADLSSLKLQNDNQRLQNKILKQQYDYNEKHGVRDPSPLNALTDYLMNYIDSHGGFPTPDKIDDMIDSATKDFREAAEEKIDDIKDSVQNSSFYEKFGTVDNLIDTGKKYVVDPYVEAGKRTVSTGKKIWNGLKNAGASVGSFFKNKWENRKSKKK